jgi:transcriptional regulator
MYTPTPFAEPRLEVLHESLRHAGLITLVTHGPDGLDASHLPMLLEPGPGPLGRLVGHLAAGNPQWKALGAGAPALAIVTGPDAYVTPGWYPSKREHGRVVPTWNYVAVHAHGLLTAFRDRARLLEVVTRLTDLHEARREARRPPGSGERWKVSDAPAGYVDGMLAGIVGVELTLTRLEGKWKASQNKGEADRRGVAEGLRRDGDEAMARLVDGTR